MKNDLELLGGTIGTALSATGTALQADEILRIISLIITIIGGIITWIVIPVINWIQKSKQDGKITPEEIKEGVEIISEGMNQVNESINKKDEK